MIWVFSGSSAFFLSSTTGLVFAATRFSDGVLDTAAVGCGVGSGTLGVPAGVLLTGVDVPAGAAEGGFALFMATVVVGTEVGAVEPSTALVITEREFISRSRESAISSVQRRAS